MYHRSNRRTSNLRSRQLLTNQEMPSRFASSFRSYDRRGILSSLAVQRAAVEHSDARRTAACYRSADKINGRGTLANRHYRRA